MSGKYHLNGQWADLPPLIGTSAAIRTALDLIARSVGNCRCLIDRFAQPAADVFEQFQIQRAL